MQKQDSQYKINAERFVEQIQLQPGEDKFARYRAWGKEKLAVPYTCKRHPQTQLVYTTYESDGIFDVFPVVRQYGVEPKPLPNVFSFRMSLKCPSCRCAYALLPPEYHTTSFETFETATPERANALKLCREFAGQINKVGSGFALFVGKPGNGKTRLAANIVRKLDNADARYVRQGELTTALRATYRHKEIVLRRAYQAHEDQENDDAPPSPLEVTQNVRFLVLDELGCSPLANDERLLLDELLKHRYDQRKPTIIISNLALDQLKEFLGDALIDRIKHATGNGRFILQFDGESFRRATGEDYLAGLK